MGIDANYQAVPDDAGLVSLAMRDPALGDILHLAPYLIQKAGILGLLPRRDPAMIRLSEMVRDLVMRYPGIETRAYRDYSRSWDRLHYLLSAERRRGESLGADLGTVAVRGATPLGDLHGGQGVPIRWNAAADVIRVASWLDGITEDALHSRFDPPQMEALHVYKFQMANVNWGEWDDLWAHFCGLRLFYRDVAARGEGILVVLD